MPVAPVKGSGFTDDPSHPARLGPSAAYRLPVSGFWGSGFGRDCAVGVTFGKKGRSIGAPSILGGVYQGMQEPKG